MLGSERERQQLLVETEYYMGFFKSQTGIVDEFGDFMDF